jgi:hypothetical protein
MSSANESRGWFDPDFCESRCPICTRAREGNRVARFFQAIEMIVTFGGCPWGRARRRKYGVRPDQPVPRPDVDAASGEGS